MRNEFEFIDHIKSKYGLDKVGDDCAVLPGDDSTDLLVTADLLIEDIDFRLDWTSPELLGHKALAVSLSDIAAMGGEPKWAMLSLAVSENLWKTDFLDAFYAGWHDLAKKHDVQLVGGDISRSPDKVVIDSVVFGDVVSGRSIRRAGAKPGDAIFVTGYLGGAGAGLALLTKGVGLSQDLIEPMRHLLLRQLQPLPQVKTGTILQELQLATAMIDISDGLSSDLRHLLDASGVGAEILGEGVPTDPAINGAALEGTSAFDLALHAGEDFELLFTTPADKIPIAMDLGFHHVGTVTTDFGVIEMSFDGKRTILEPRGYRHFG